MSYDAGMVADFQQLVWRYFDDHGRHDLLWRIPEADGTYSPYKILVSEVMLQQTQVAHVTPKYMQFLQQFPTVHQLAAARLGEVLVAWQGLGYNRRAKFLWQAAQMVVNEYNGVFPADQRTLTALPGVGFNTAGAVVAYAYNQPVVFVETNIRTVFIHHFFADAAAVPDKDIIELVAASLPGEIEGSTRQWYWALMDYGTHIKQTIGNASRASKSYTKQSSFAGSRRAVRGAVIRQLSLAGQGMSADELAVHVTDARLLAVLHDLETEGMVRLRTGKYLLA